MNRWAGGLWRSRGRSGYCHGYIKRNWKQGKLSCHSGQIITRKHDKIESLSNRQSVDLVFSQSGCHMNVGVTGGEKQKMRHSVIVTSAQIKTVTSQLITELPRASFHVGRGEGLRNTRERRSLLSLAISTEVKAFIWRGSLFSSSWRLTAFYHTGASALLFPRTKAIPAALTYFIMSPWLTSLPLSSPPVAHCQCVTNITKVAPSIYLRMAIFAQ